MFQQRDQPIPSVPRREQSYGYEEITVDVSAMEEGTTFARKYRPLPKPADTYSGTGNDTVGPSFYKVRLKRGKVVSVRGH
jgi:hypothetical protein